MAPVLRISLLAALLAATCSYAAASPTRAEPTAAAALAADPWNGCFDAYNRTCLTDWSATPTDVSFAIRCTPPSAVVHPLNWCAVGISTSGNLTAWGMVPASVFMLQVLSDGSVVVEDRITSNYSSPPCAATQLSTLTWAAVDAAGTLRANWTRPRAVPPAAAGQGYAPIVDAPQPLIAATAASAAPHLAAKCGAPGGHQAATAGRTANFLAPPPFR